MFDKQAENNVNIKLKNIMKYGTNIFDKSP